MFPQQQIEVIEIMTYAEAQTVEVHSIPCTEYRYQHFNFLPQAPQVWDKPTAKAQIGDYFRIPFVPVTQVVEKDVLQDGRVWLLVKPVFGSTTEEWVLEPETLAPAQRQLEQKPQKEPVGLAGDTVSCQLQPTQSAATQFETGHHHGRADAEARRHPMYTKPSGEYATGYLEGYHNNSTEQPPAPTQPVEWSVTYNSKWQWYEVWVKGRCIDHSSTLEQAERIAQKYIATNEMIQRQNAAVIAAVAG